MFVRARMSKNIQSVAPREPLSKVYALMKEKGFEGVPVLDGPKVVGVITMWDILTRLAEIDHTDRYLEETIVGDVMAKQPITIHEDEIIEEAAMLMHKYDISLLPVVDDGDKVVGVITQSDFFRIFVEVLGLERRGTRISLLLDEKVGELARVTEIIRKKGVNIISLVTFEPGRPFGDIVIRVDTIDSKPVVDALVDGGFRVVHVSQVWA